MSDLFMKRLYQNKEWSTFCPNDSGLGHVYGEEFEKRYLESEKNGLARDTQ